MLESSIESQIIYENFKFFQIDQVKLYEESGKEISKILVDRFGKTVRYNFILGLGGNAADGISTAINLAQQNVEVKCYLIGRPKNFSNNITLEFWDKLEELKKVKDNLYTKQECYAEDIEQGEINVECLVGTGFEGEKLGKRFHDIIKRISHFTNPLVAIDQPAPSYSPDMTISLLYPKTKDAILLDLELKAGVENLVGPGEVKQLFTPKKFSHKSKNGKVLFISNTKEDKFIKLISEVARQYFVDVNYFNPMNDERSSNINILKEHDVIESIRSVDTVILGDFDDSIISNGILSEVAKANPVKLVLVSSNLKLEWVELFVRSKDKLVRVPEKFISENKLSRSLKNFCIENKIHTAEFTTKATIYNPNGDFKLDNDPGFSRKTFQEIFYTIVAILSTKNNTWLSMRAALFITDRLIQIEKSGEVKIENVSDFFGDVMELFAN